MPSKGLVSNSFITDDCTRDAEERPKEHYGRMMDDEFAVDACGLPSPADDHFCHHQIAYFLVISLSFIKHECSLVFYKKGSSMESIKIPGSCDSSVKNLILRESFYYYSNILISLVMKCITGRGKVLYSRWSSHKGYNKTNSKIIK